MKKAVVHNAVLYKSPIGEMVLCARGRALTGAWFVGQQHFAEGFEIRMTDKPVAVLKKAMKWLDRYFQGENPEVDFPIEFYGTPFQKNVWQLLRIIPMGVTISYSELARCLKALTGTGGECARAMGSAVGRNPISVIVPCHRVVGKRGKLTGYAGGLERKLYLLEHENAWNFLQMKNMFEPKPV